MKTIAQLRAALQRVENIAAFSRAHKLPARTLWRIRSGASVRLGTIALVDAALGKAKHAAPAVAAKTTIVPIDPLDGLSAQAKNCLRAARMHTVDDVRVAMESGKLWLVRNMGNKRQCEVRFWLDSQRE